MYSVGSGGWGSSQSINHPLSGLAYWFSDGNIEEAVRRIIACYQSRSERLDLSGLGLSTLPEEICKLTDLKVLHCDHNNLRYLPTGIGKLIRLQVLNCNSNELWGLPSHEMGTLTNLQNLNCSDNKIWYLPNEINSLTNLQELNFENNEFTLLPGTSLEALTNARLRFRGNRISEVPRYLSHLNIEIDRQSPTPAQGTYVSPTAPQLFNGQVPAQRQPTAVRDQQPRPSQPYTANTASLFRNSTAPDRPMPAQRRATAVRNQPVLTVQPTTNNFDRYSFNQIKNALPESKKDLKQLQIPTLEADSALSSNLSRWLSLLTRSADFTNSNTCSITAERVLSILKMAEKDPVFRGIFSNTLALAVDDCTDKATFHLTALEVQKAIIDCKAKSLIEMLKVLKGAFAAGLLEEWTRDFVKRRENARFGSAFTEEVEAYLAFQVKLKAKLQLPIGVTGMNYIGCSRIRDGDVAQAEAEVNQQLKDKEKFAAFLVNQEVWTERLTKDFDSERRRTLAPVENQMERLDEANAMVPMDTQDYCQEANRIMNEVKAADQTWFKNKTKQLLNSGVPSQINPAPSSQNKPAAPSKSRQAAPAKSIPAPSSSQIRLPAPAQTRTNAPSQSSPAPSPQIRPVAAPSQVSQTQLSPQHLETVITIRCKDLPNNKDLFIRGKGAGLSWNQGICLTRIDWERFEFRTRTPFSGELAYKLLINDDTTKWETGENHKTSQGNQIDRTPSFSKEVLPSQTKTILTVDYELPPGQTLCLKGTGPLGNWDYSTPMESVRNDNKRWYLSFDGQFSDFKYKLVLDAQYEQGENKVAKCGTRTAIKRPNF